jgi:hypothetical protein
LALPLLATAVAAVVVPALARRRSRGLTPAQRAARLQDALAPRHPSHGESAG